MTQIHFRVRQGISKVIKAIKNLRSGEDPTELIEKEINRIWKNAIDFESNKVQDIFDNANFDKRKSLVKEDSVWNIMMYGKFSVSENELIKVNKERLSKRRDENKNL